MWSTALVCNLGLSQTPLVLQASAMSVPTWVILGWTPARPKASGIAFLFQVWAEVWVDPKENCMIWWGHVGLFYKAHMMKFLQSWFVCCWKNRDQEALKRYSAPGTNMQTCRSIYAHHHSARITTCEDWNSKRWSHVSTDRKPWAWNPSLHAPRSSSLLAGNVGNVQSWE